MVRRRFVVVALLTGCCALPASATASEFDLSGTWSSTAPNAGTTLVLTQTGDTIKWTGGPANKAWVQVYKGTLNGDIFSGEFEQDEPGVQPPRYHGTLEAEVLDDCEFKTIHVLQAGQADAGGAVFAKAGCTPTPAAISGTWQVRAKQKLGSTLVAMVGAGNFSADQNGQITSTRGAKGNLVVSLLNLRNRRLSDAWHLKITGPGSYHKAATTNGSGAISLVVEVVSTSNRSLAHLCKADPFGTLTLRPDGPTGPTAGLSICSRNFPLRASVARAILH